MKTKFTTPLGISHYTYIDKPDFKFDVDGVYHGEVHCKYTDCVDLLEQIDTVFETLYADMCTEKQKDKLPIYTRGYEEFVNENGDRVIKFKFKTKALITTKKGDTFEKTVPVYDHKGNIMTEVPAVGNNSKIRVAFELFPYHTAMIGFGITLRFIALQLIDLVPYEYDTFDSLGFTVTDEDDNDAEALQAQQQFENRQIQI